MCGFKSPRASKEAERKWRLKHFQVAVRAVQRGWRRSINEVKRQNFRHQEAD